MTMEECELVETKEPTPRVPRMKATLCAIAVICGIAGMDAVTHQAQAMVGEKRTSIQLLLAAAEQGDNCAQVQAGEMFTTGHIARDAAHPVIHNFSAPRNDALGYYWQQIAASGDRNANAWCDADRGSLSSRDPAAQLTPDQKVAINAAVARWRAVHGKADAPPPYATRIEP